MKVVPALRPWGKGRYARPRIGTRRSVLGRPHQCHHAILTRNCAQARGLWRQKPRPETLLLPALSSTLDINDQDRLGRERKRFSTSNIHSTKQIYPFLTCSMHPTHDGQDGPPLGFFACPPHFVVRGTATPGPERRSPGHLPPSSLPPPPQGHPQARPSRRPLRTLNAPDTSSLGPAPAPRILHRRRPLWATRSRCHVRLCRSCISPKPVPVLVSVRRTRPGPLLTLTT